jgi:RNA polymerase sigma-70 factor (ECF subfamily)
MVDMQIEWFKSDIVPLRQTLFRTALKWLQNEKDAEDAVQETLLRLWNVRNQLEAVSNRGAFAMQITKNICIDRLRTAKEHTEVTDIYIGANNETPYLKVEREDTVVVVKEIVKQLPKLQRIIIQMRDIEDYELQEIAEITGTQVSAVAVNLSRARKTVREQLIKVMNYEFKK